MAGAGLLSVGVDGGQFKLHVRAHTGTRIEDTARLCDQIENVIRQEIPQAELGTVIDNIGIPYSGLNLSYSNSAPVGTADADILVSLNEKHRPTAEYTHALREKLTQQFPGTEFYYLPTDMVSQILNFGLPAQIDVQLVGAALQQNRDLAEHMMQQISHIPGTTDLRIQQPFNLPKWTVNVDRTRAQQVGYSQRDIAQDVLIGLSGSFQTDADVLSESAEPCQLQHRGADAAVRRGEPAGTCRTSPSRPTERRSSRRFSATWRRSIAARSRAR